MTQTVPTLLSYGGRYYVETALGIRRATDPEIQRAKWACRCWACRDLEKRPKPAARERATA